MQGEVVYDALLHKGVFDDFGEADRFDHCERDRLEESVLEGRIRYVQYMDSLKNAYIYAFKEHLDTAIKEELKIDYRTAR